MSEEYLLTKKSYIQDIVRAIKSKDPTVNTLKIKNIDDAITNLPSEQSKIPLTLTASLKNRDGISLAVAGHLGVNITDGSTLTGPLKDGLVHVYAKNGFWEEINSKYTSSTGDFEIDVGNYEMYKVEYKGNSTFHEVEHIVEEPTLTALVQADETGLLEIKLVEGANLKTLAKDRVVSNNNGLIQEMFDHNEIVEVVYKGPITTVKSGNLYWEGVRSIHVPYSVSDLDYESVFYNKPNLEEVFLQDSQIIYMPRFEHTPNLKVVRLPETITSFPMKIMNCNLDYVNIPSKNNPLLNAVLSNSTVKCLDIESGIDQELDSSAFGLDSTPALENVHFIIPGKPIGKEVPNLSFNYVFPVANYRNARIDFQADTERILEYSAEEIMYPNRINIPAGCTYMEEDVFRYSHMQSPAILRFEGLIPPRFGPDNDPTRCFTTDGEKYNVLCPYSFIENYEHIFSSYEDYFFLHDGTYEEYPTHDDYGEFCIEILGKSLKTDPDKAYTSQPFEYSENTAKYYLDDIVQEGNFDFGEALNFEFPYYGRHTLTVAGGFRRVSDEAFLNNKDIIKFRFPDSFDSIAPLGFTGCSNLRTLILPMKHGAPVLEYDDDVGCLDGLHPDCKIFVPEFLVDWYAEIPDFAQYTIVPMKDYIEEE